MRFFCFAGWSIFEALHKHESHGRLSSCCSTVLLYVRTESEEVFDALMLNTPTLTSLREAVSPDKSCTHTDRHTKSMHARTHTGTHTRTHTRTHARTHGHTLTYTNIESTLASVHVSMYSRINFALLLFSDFWKVRHSEGQHREDVQEMQKRVSTSSS
jgi:hypothetical protein